MKSPAGRRAKASALPAKESLGGRDAVASSPRRAGSSVNAVRRCDIRTYAIVPEGWKAAPPGPMIQPYVPLPVERSWFAGDSAPVSWSMFHRETLPVYEPEATR
jgi:hypothetical protein